MVERVNSHGDPSMRLFGMNSDGSYGQTIVTPQRALAGLRKSLGSANVVKNCILLNASTSSKIQIQAYSPPSPSTAPLSVEPAMLTFSGLKFSPDKLTSISSSARCIPAAPPRSRCQSQDDADRTAVVVPRPAAGADRIRGGPWCSSAGGSLGSAKAGVGTSRVWNGFGAWHSAPVSLRGRTKQPLVA
jgi:hypothetical protein